MTITHKLCLAITIGLLSIGASKKKEVIKPLLEFTGAECIETVDLSAAIAVPDDKKSMKKMLKRQVANLSDFMTEESPCLINHTSESNSPYALFEIPKGIKGLIIYAGSANNNITFAVDVTTLGEDGRVLQTFKADKYRVMNQIYGVQFSPGPDDAYVLIKANEDLIGNVRETIESRVTNQRVSMQYNNIHSSGTNRLGSQHNLERVFSYNGWVGLKMVFPKQPKQKKK